jgi:universal stress protein A
VARIVEFCRYNVGQVGRPNPCHLHRDEITMKKILFPTDFSPASKVALEYAAKLAKQDKARLLIVHVAAPYAAVGTDDTLIPIGDKTAQKLEKQLRTIKPKTTGVKCEYKLAWGDPVAEISTLARKERCQAVVMSSHGRTGLARLLTGSVTEAVAHRVPCTILIVRRPLKSKPAAK